MQVVVFGNVTLDVICYPIEDVPRNNSITFENSVVSPGGCGSNVAIGLSALGISSALVAYTGNDMSADFLEAYWKRWGIDCRYVHRSSNYATGVSVGLVDHNFQPRFIHTPGANRLLTAEDLKIREFVEAGAKALHIAGYFVLPGILDSRLGEALAYAKSANLITSLDVVHNSRMKNPEPLWNCLPYLDYFLCNQREALEISGVDDCQRAAETLRQRGAQVVIIKLGKEGCWVTSDSWQGIVKGVNTTRVVDTTGAGDAFAAGFISAIVSGKAISDACQAGNQAGARMVGTLGAIAGWEV